MPVIARGLNNLRDLQRRLGSVHSKAVPKMAERVGVALVKQVMDEFRESRDPYDRPWAPVFRGDRRSRNARLRRYRKLSRAGLPLSGAADKPLMNTGRLRGSTGFAVTGNRVRIFLSANYASHHDQPDGEKHRIKRRQILPSPGNLGQKWGAAVEKEASRVISEHFRSG